MARDKLVNRIKRFLSLLMTCILIVSGFIAVVTPIAIADGVDTEFSSNSNVMVNLTTIAPSTVAPGSNYIGMINLTINNSGGIYDTLQWVNITILNFNDVQDVTIWNETNDDGTFTTSDDTWVGTGNIALLSGDLGFSNVTGLNIGINDNTNQSFYVVFNISSSATHGHLINASIAANNMNMTNAHFGGLVALYPAYDTMIDGRAPKIVSITTTDADGNGEIENATIEFSEAILDSTIDASRFYIGGLACSSFSTMASTDDNIIEIALATGISGTDVKDVTYSFLASACTDLADNELANVNTNHIQELDGASPIILEATTNDVNGNGKIDQYVLKFSENVTAYSGFYSEINIDGYTVDVANSYQSDSNEVTITLIEGSDFDTGARPDITYPSGLGSLIDLGIPFPIDISSGDLNDDSFSDLVILNARTRSITVFLHDGIGQFKTRMDYPAGITRGNITVGDVNNDGLNDVVATDFNNGDLLVFTQNSITNKLNSYVNYASGDGALGVAIGDVNNDHRNDIVVANYDDDQIAIFIQNGVGGLNSPTYYATGDGPMDVVIADITKTENYGYVLYDVVVTNYLEDSITPYRQNTGGTLTTLTSISTPDGPTGIAAGDLNDDGWIDVAIANRNDNSTTVIQQYASSWNNAYLSGSYRYDYDVDINPTDIAVIDANNDGRNDIITTNPGNNSVVFMLQDGSGDFSMGWNKTLNNTPFGLAVGDFNLDGHFDAVTTVPNENYFTVLSQKPEKLAFDTRQDIYLGSNVRGYNPRAVDIGDINNDGYNDIVVVDYNVIKISVFYGHPAGGFRDKVDYSINDGGWWYPYDVKIGDLNDDGLNDVGVVLENVDILAIFYQNQSGKLNKPVFNNTGDSPRRLAIGDANNDGLNDVVVTNYYDYTISVFIQNSGTGLLNPKQDYSTGLYYPYGIAIGEVTGDNRNDVVVTHDYWNNYYHMVRFKQKADGTLDTAEQFQWENNNGLEFYDVEIADMNNDGRNDIISGRRDSNYVGVWYQNVAKSFGTATTYYMTQHYYYDIEIEDINIDGRKDIIAASYNNNVVKILGGTQTGFEDLGSYSVGSSPHGIAVGDINSDGGPDIVTANYNGNSITILKQNLNNHAYNNAVFNFTRDQPWKLAKGDVNNDGLIDIAVVCRNWPYYLSIFHQTNAGVFGPRVDYSLDYYPYSVEIGDVNNDGRNDVVVGDNWDSVIVFTQRNDGTLNNYVRYYCPYEPYDVAIGDLNNDGRNDVGVASYRYMFRYLQTNTGTLSSYNSYYISSATNLKNIAIGDINNDSRDDVVMTENSDDYIHYYTQTNTGGMSGYYTLSTGDAPVDIGIGDFNNDGLNDIVNTNYGSFDSISIFTQRASGGFNSPNSYNTNSNPWGLDVVDFNSDGLDDVIVADYGASTISIFYQNSNGYMNSKESYDVFSNPRFIKAHDFDNDNIVEIVTSHESYDYIHTIYPEKTLGKNSSLVNYQLGTNSLQQVQTGDVNEQDGADPVYALAITGNLTIGNSSAYNEIMVRFSEDINDTTVDTSDFSISGDITLTTANEISPGNIILDTSLINSSETPIVTLVGSVKDVNNLTVPLRSRLAKDGLRPRALSAVTRDKDLNGQIDEYIITFDEDIIGTFNGTGFSVTGYTIDTLNSSRTGPNEFTLALVEKVSFDTGLTPNITYTPGDIRDSSGNYLADVTSITESDGSPPAVADMYVYQIYENHPNLYVPNNTVLIYNNTPAGLDATFHVRVEAFDNGRLAYSQGEDAFGNSSVIDTTENTGGTSWEYELNYTINQGEYKNPGINVTVYDIDNNNATDSFSVILDITPPISTMYTELGVRYVASFTPITLTAADATDIYVTRYQVDSDPWQDYTGPFKLSSYSSGEHVLRYYSIDMVNNTESVNIQPVYIAEDWTSGVPAFGTYQNTVILGCNLTISGTLVFENVTLLINSTSTTYPQWINVTSGGRFIVRNSTIISVSPSYRSRFIMNGTLNMYNVLVGELWADPAMGIGGLEIYTDSANIDLCHFHNASGSAVYIDGASPSITNSTFKDSGSGIVVSNGAPTIYKNSIMNTAIGIKIANNSDEIILDGNTMNDVGFGIYCIDVFSADQNLRIMGNTIRNAAVRAITVLDSYSATSQLEIDNNTLENVMGGILVQGMNGPDVIIRDNIIKNLTGRNVGIIANGNSITYIEHNIFTNTYGNVIQVYNNTNKAVIANNNLNGGTGVLLDMDSFITAYNNQGQIHIKNNNIRGTSNIYSIGTRDNDNNTQIYISDNQLNNNGIGGIWFNEYADSIYVENNTVNRNYLAIWANHKEQDNNDTLVLKNNEFTNNTGVGISIDDINNILIENNLVSHTSGVGIELYDNVWGNLYLNNNEIIENSNYGLYLKDSSINLGRSVTNNTFINNQNGGAALYTDFNPGTWHIYDHSIFIHNFPFFNGHYPNLEIHNNSNLSIASTQLDWFNDITVHKGGMLYAYDTIFSGPSYYDFNVFGDVYLSTCIIEYAEEMYVEDPGYFFIPATTFRYCNSNGLHLKNANITLSNSRFNDNNGNGLFVENSHPIIRLCEFRSNNNHGIYAKNFTGNITECEFLWNNGDNIRLRNSGGMVYYNFVYQAGDDNIHLIYSSTTIKKNVIGWANGYGIYLDHSNAHISLNDPIYNYRVRYGNWGNYDCYIRDSSDDGIYVYYSNPHIENNTIWNNDKSGISIIYSGGHIEYNEIAYNTGNGVGRFAEKNPWIHDNYMHDNGDSPPNRAPSCQGGTIRPQFPIYISSLSISPVGWYDPDGDPPGFLYQWQKNVSGVWTNIPGATGSTLTGGIFGGDEIRCRLTPWDGKTTGTAVTSSSKFINNSAPSITSASISPSPAYDNSALTAVPNGFSDPDKDTTQVYYYQWYNQSGELSGSTSATLPPSKFKANDTIYCFVKPSDGEDNGTAVKSISVLIIHYTDPGQGVADYDGDGVPDAADAFPYDINEWRDTDLDGIGDNSDNDIDGDGKNNSVDAFDYDKYEWIDSDNDGVGDNTDQDDDDDGYLDVQDAFPFNATEWRDLDSDDIGDNSDDDIDGDGVNNTFDAFPYNKFEIQDSDGDGVGDNTDQDDDDDGYYDLFDAFPLNANEHLDTDKDRIGDNADTDDDGDGYLDDWESELGSDNKSYTSKPLDTDNDGNPDGDSSNSKVWMDIDDDNDGYNDTAEIANNTNPKDPDEYPGMPNRAPSITKVSLTPTPAYDNSIISAVPEGFSDPDGDTTQVYYYKWYVNNVLEPNVTSAYITPTYFQANDTVYCVVTPSDGEDNGTDVKSIVVLIIHYTDPGDKPKDYDGDGVIDSQDAFPFDKNEWRDTDSDGIGDNSDSDIDGDGKNNTMDEFDFDKYEWKDSDGDGLGDNTDQDDDDDGYYDVNDDFPLDPLEHSDNDKDGVGDNADSDDDNDGFLDGWEAFMGSDNKSYSSQPLDTDNDDIPDGDNTNSKAWMDTDDDDDGHSDSNEKAAGTDPLDPKSYPGAPNRAPSITKASISPSPAYDNSMLTAVPEGFSDPDGDTTQVYYYQWYVNGLKLSGQINSYLSPNNFKANDTVFCMVTPSDGIDNGTAIKSFVILILHYTEPGQEPKDYDGDGVPDDQDAFPYDINEWRDTDGDGTGDNSDNDIDGDGYDNDVEISANSNPYNDLSIPGDIDGDSILDINDEDIDGDNVINDDDEFPYDKTETKDNDKDGIGDNADQDDDNDGTLDSQDDFPFDSNEWHDTDGDRIGDNSDLDIDGDGVENTDDDFPNDRTESKDTDHDGTGDNTDRDIDGDGVANDQDDFPNNSTEWRDTDGDGIGDNTDNDIDGDGINNEDDDFPNEKGDWEDTDGDKLGDNIDPDDDNDGIADPQDKFPKDKDEWKDSDEDGIGDNSDNDRDGDGIDNEFDIFPDDKGEWADYDEDGIGDNKDPDDDDDGVPDFQDSFIYDKTQWKDTDGDGLGDNPGGRDPDTDIDGDGILNDHDLFPIDKDEWEDTDSDGLGNNRDPDDDNDGVVDIKDDYPLDPLKSKIPTEAKADDKAAEDGIDIGLLMLIIAMIIILVFLGFMYMKMQKQLSNSPPESKPPVSEQKRRPETRPGMVKDRTSDSQRLSDLTQQIKSTKTKRPISKKRPTVKQGPENVRKQ